jgi:gas vesicle protein
MNTKEVKAQIRKQADQIESGVEVAANELGDGVDAVAEKNENLQDTLREFGQRMLESVKTLTDEATKQAQQRPLAVFGFAFLAGVIAARVLRR